MLEAWRRVIEFGRLKMHPCLSRPKSRNESTKVVRPVDQPPKTPRPNSVKTGFFTKCGTYHKCGTFHTFAPTSTTVRADDSANSHAPDEPRRFAQPPENDRILFEMFRERNSLVKFKAEYEHALFRRPFAIRVFASAVKVHHAA